MRIAAILGRLAPVLSAGCGLLLGVDNPSFSPGPDSTGGGGATDAAMPADVSSGGSAGLDASTERQGGELEGDGGELGGDSGEVESGARDADAATPLRWRTLGDLSQYLVIFFDLQVAADGTPYAAILNLTPPGRARVTIVFRYDGVAWQKVGGIDLPGSEESSFALAPDGTPYIVVTGTIRTFQGGQWQQLPDVGQGLLVPTQYPAIAIDRSGRLNSVVFDPLTGGTGLARFDGTNWELVGARDSLGNQRLPMALGFDGNSPYVAINDTGSFQTDVRHFTGSTWESIGGGLAPTFNASFAVTDNGFAILAFANGASVDTIQTPPSPWASGVFIPAYLGGGVQPTPAMDIGLFETVYLAYLGDRDASLSIITPGAVVSSWNGVGPPRELPTEGLDPTVFGLIKVKVARQADRDVPYVGYVSGNSLVVKKLE